MNVVYCCYRQAFFTRAQAEQGRRDWVRAVSQSVGNRSLYCPASDTQISAYLMQKMEEYYSSLEEGECKSRPPKIAAVVSGLQPASREQPRQIWVMNGMVHIDEDGNLVKPEESPYLWLGDYGPGDIRGASPQTLATSVTTEQSSDALVDLFDALKQVHRHNFPAALMVLGSQILCTHYDAVMACEYGGQVPVTIIFGQVGLGKSKAVEAAQSMMGLPKIYRPSKITDVFATRFATQTTLGYVIEDPSDPGQIAEKILVNFEKGTYLSSSSSLNPRCTFMTTMNMNCIASLSNMHKR